ncbi:MAG TPA: hypothetical protein PLA31_04835, partial [Clostridia bacterium]|nr:hypothetical protein [Clostridia bacterium]
MRRSVTPPGRVTTDLILTKTDRTNVYNPGLQTKRRSKQVMKQKRSLGLSVLFVFVMAALLLSPL